MLKTHNKALLVYKSKMTEAELRVKVFELLQSLAVLRGESVEIKRTNYDVKRGIKRVLNSLVFEGETRNETGTLTEANLIARIVLYIGLTRLSYQTTKSIYPKWGRLSNVTQTFGEHSILLMLYTAKVWGNKRLLDEAKERLTAYRKLSKQGELK